MRSQTRSNRKPTGGLYHKMSKKAKHELGGDFHAVKIGKEKRKVLRIMGGNSKVKLLYAEFANVVDPSTGKSQKAKIITVKENTADPNFVRMNVITRGCVIETELGLAKVTSRVGQDGVVNAILAQKKA